MRNPVAPSIIRRRIVGYLSRFVERAGRLPHGGRVIAQELTRNGPGVTHAYHADVADRGPADLSRLHAIVPVRGSGVGKSRLGEALDPEERLTLVVGMLVQTLTALADLDRVPACPRRHRRPTGQARGARLPREPARHRAEPMTTGETDLNAALLRGRDRAVEGAASAVLYLPADLPHITTQALDGLLDAADAALAAGSGRPVVVVAPGRRACRHERPAGRARRHHRSALRRGEPGGSRARGGTRGRQRAAGPRPGARRSTSTRPDDLERLETTQLIEIQALGQAALDALGQPGRVGRGRLTDGDPFVRRPSGTPRDPRGRRSRGARSPIPGARRGSDDETLAPRAGDVLVVTQKVVSKAEGCVVDLTTITPRQEAIDFAAKWDRDARQVEVVMRESAEILRMERGIVVSRTRHGFVCANAGVDASNTGTKDLVTLLPSDPDASAARLRERLPALVGLGERRSVRRRHQRLVRSSVAVRHRRRCAWASPACHRSTTCVASPTPTAE